MNGSSGAIAEILMDLHHVTTPAFDATTRERVFNDVLRRLSDAEALTATVNDETGAVSIDVERLLIAIGSMQHFLITRLAEARGVAPETIQFEIREFASALDED